MKKSLAIFLDIDGVLNVWGRDCDKDRIVTKLHPLAHFNPIPLRTFSDTLRNIHEAYGGVLDLHIVISSTWRKTFEAHEFAIIATEIPEFSYILSFVRWDKWKTGSDRREFRGQ